jgi:hypothetical protein
MTTSIQVYEIIRQKVKLLSKILRFDKLKKKLGRKLALAIEDAISAAVFWKKQNIKTKKSVFEILELERYCSYKTFVVSVNRCLQLALLASTLLLRLNWGNAHLVKHTDATDIPVCLNKNGGRHKTMQSQASWSNNGKGYYYGLKLHLTSDLNRKVLAVKFTTANASDREVLLSLNRNLNGLFIADSGYVSEELRKRFYREGKRMLIAKPYKTMKKLATAFELWLYDTRMLVEINFRILKEFLGLVTSLPRSVTGYLANYTYALLAYLIA